MGCCHPSVKKKKGKQVRRVTVALRGRSANGNYYTHKTKITRLGISAQINCICIQLSNKQTLPQNSFTQNTDFIYYYLY